MEAVKEHALLKEEIDEEDIARIVAKWTGIPVTRMMEGEIQKLVQMPERLKDRVVGQDTTVQLVANAILRNRAGLSDPNRPIGSFIFLGPTGVGKTELVRALAEYLFDDDKAMIRVDMSEYMEKHAVARMVGSPPGYIGHDEGGQLTEQVRRRPYSVLLFDEIEKAHPDVFHLLLQILDDGRLTDGQGRTVSFKNTVIVMTSNVGTGMVERNTIGFSVHGKDTRTEETRKRLLESLRQQFRPEFLNRVDDIIVFNSLTREHLARIVDIQLNNVGKLLKDRKLKLEITTAAKDRIITEGYDPQYGARPMKRAIQRLIQDPLALKLITGGFAEGDTILVDAAAEPEPRTDVHQAGAPGAPVPRANEWPPMNPIVEAAEVSRYANMSINTLKTAALLGFLTALLLIGGQAIAGRQGLYMALADHGDHEFCQLLFLRQDRAHELLGAGGDGDRERRRVSPGGADGAQSLRAHGAAHAEAVDHPRRFAQRVRHRPQPVARVAGLHRRHPAADGRQRTGGRDRARTGPRAAPRYPDQFGGRDDRGDHHFRGPDGLLVRRQPG